MNEREIIRSTQPYACHVTPQFSVNEILLEGLVPQIGKRASACNEKYPAVYLFPTVLAAEEAVVNWLGDEFPDDCQLVILSIFADGLPLEYQGYELICRKKIGPERIRVLHKI